MTAFPHEVVLNILLCLEQKDVVRAQLVNKYWYGYAQVARKEAFLRRWGFSSVSKEPRVPSLYETIPESSIVRKHTVARGETLPQLAFRYSVDPTHLLRINNLMSPHLLQHRPEVFVPVSNPEMLRGCSAAFEFSTLLFRDLLIAAPPLADVEREVLKDGSGSGGHPGAVKAAPSHANFNRMLVREMQAHVRRLLQGPAGGGEDGRAGRAAGRHPAAGGALGSGAGRRGGAGRAELVVSAAAASVDLASARFYLEDSGGCPQRAAQLFVEDLTWDHRGVDSDRDTSEQQDEAAALIRMMAASDRPHRQAGSLPASRDLVDGRKAKRRRWRQRLLRVLLMLSCAGCCAGRSHPPPVCR